MACDHTHLSYYGNKHFHHTLSITHYAHREIGITGGSFENEPNTYGVRKKSLFKQKSFTELVEIWLTK